MAVVWRGKGEVLPSSGPRARNNGEWRSERTGRVKSSAQNTAQGSQAYRVMSSGGLCHHRGQELVTMDYYP